MPERVAGSQVGPYDLIALVGSGGAGEVWKAYDARLDRVVAIKFSRDNIPEQVAREARTIASLNHPNICQIYDVGPDFLVMEFVAGEDIRAIKDTRRIVDIATQIADGLAAAHLAGIIHRDLKPQNIMLARDGRVKILDFGLAALTHSGGSTEVLTPSESGTISVVGTPAYMSPEQSTGAALDIRSDQFSFGSILYELISGRRAFERDSPSATLAAINRMEPPSLPNGVPQPLVWVIERCHRKEREERYESTKDLYLELRGLRDHLTQLLAPAEQPRRPKQRRRERRVALLAALLSLPLGGLTTWLLGRPAPPQLNRLQRITDFVGMEGWPTLSPDLKSIAFVSRAGGHRQIWLRLLGSGGAQQITRDEVDHEEPRFTPDSSSILYYSPSSQRGLDGALWQIPALGGTPRLICPSVGGGDISHDGRHVAAFQLHDGQVELIRLSIADGSSKLLARLPAPYHYYEPRWSPDDRSVAFRRGNYVFDEALFVVGADGGGLRPLAQDNGSLGLSFVADGSSLVHSSSHGSTVLYPPTFNLFKVGVNGRGREQLTFGEVSYLSPDIRANLLVASRVRFQSDIWRYPLTGTATENRAAGVRITHQTGQVQTPSVSPDGSVLVYISDSGGHGNLWISSIDGTQHRQLTFERDPGVVVGLPQWSPRGDLIAYVVNASALSIRVVRPDGTGTRLLVPGGARPTWTTRGDALLYTVLERDGLCMDSIRIDDGVVSRLRCENSVPISVDAQSRVVYATQLNAPNGGVDYELRRSEPGGTGTTLITKVEGRRVTLDPVLFQPTLSPDGKTMIAALSDGDTSNLYSIAVTDGEVRRVVDFGDRSTLIARRVSFSPDGRSAYAAVAEIDADIVMIEGLLR
jgi:serine/threonine protein kinase